MLREIVAEAFVLGFVLVYLVMLGFLAQWAIRNWFRTSQAGRHHAESDRENQKGKVKGEKSKMTALNAG